VKHAEALENSEGLRLVEDDTAAPRRKMSKLQSGSELPRFKHFASSKRKDEKLGSAFEIFFEVSNLQFERIHHISAGA
jgi:hypothetical protein